MKKNITKTYAVALYEALRGTNEKELENIIKNFVAMLGKRGIIGRADRIISDFIDYYNEREGIVNVEITSARELEDDICGKIVKHLEKSLGEKIEISKKIDAGILGGIILRMKDMVVDGSFRGQLAEMEKEMIK